MNLPTALTRLALCSLPILVGCGEQVTSSKPFEGTNLLFVTVDTLRADHLSLYGYSRATSPNLDRFGEQSVVFENATAQTSWTLGSLASLMSSQWVGQLNVRDFRSRVSESVVTLAEVLRGVGYETAAVGTHLVFLEKYGLRQGIDQFDDDLVLSDYRDSHRAITSKQVTEKALTWLGERRSSEQVQPWFLWLHYFDPHIPYLKHPGLVSPFGTGVRDRYDGEIVFTDAQVGRVLDFVGESTTPTVVVFTADHGEEFNDHGGKEHGHTLYQELLHVPLLIRAPGLSPRRVPGRVGLVDVMPTVLALLEISDSNQPAGLVGRSLLPEMNGEIVDPAPNLSELRLRDHTNVDALISGRWKLIVPRNTEVPELYELDS
ncbi:MAG: choline-sulfatase, partial [Planctomycetota bacterium]